jgi:hypothetical protein
MQPVVGVDFKTTYCITMIASRFWYRFWNMKKV